MAKKKKEVLVVTTHAYSRMEERFGWKHKPTAFKTAKKAMEIGLCHNEFPMGECRRWADGLFLRQKKATNMRYFAEGVFLFRYEKLLTVIRVPVELRKEFHDAYLIKKEKIENGEIQIVKLCKKEKKEWSYQDQCLSF